MSDKYEIMYILRPDLSDDQANESVERYKGIIETNGATDIEIQQRGKRRLAYLIGKHRDGIYVQVNYTGSGKEIAPLERAMRLSEDVIRYLSLKLDPPKKAAKAAAAAAALAESEDAA
ncbi:30S ribosomal protein S6 [Chamaesiphon sp. VAR_48_metabat_135_sub]|uniref:30S ribosomal protein S6 n=1 Tax=Chamaesiphon sp. VAR_48_metabat_135_sub TaxID=2964699 RepID=UPI00286C7156|nr:30S ribosomal protein S6 [Chamaesiphon sp. VAR_48_metabat_135_sub]